MVTLFFVSALVLLILGVPLAYAVGLSSIIYIILNDIPYMVIIQRLFAGIDVASFLAIPFFILAGDLMLTGGLAKRLVKFANSLVGGLTGGLAIVTILGCMFFAAISGSSIATAAAVGSIMIPEMVKRKYDPQFASAIVGAASPMGVIIPPSITFIVYGTMTSTSIKDLYLVGIPAGIMIGLSLMIVAYIIAKKNGYKGDDQPFSFKEVLSSCKEAIWALLTPVIMVGGVFGGWFTPTESAVIAVVYAIIVGVFVYKELKWRDLYRIFLNSAKTTSNIMVIIANATIFAYVLTVEKIPQSIAAGLLSISDNPIIILLLINLLLLILGAFMETMAILVIMVPMFLPIVLAIGVDPVLFGAIVIVNTAIGMVTPPFGVCLLTAGSIGKVKMGGLMRQSVIPIIAMIIALLLMTYIPSLIMWPLS